MADYIEITDYTNFYITSSNVPKLMGILEEHINKNPELADELGISLDANFEPEDFGFEVNRHGDIVSMHLDGKEISSAMEKMFIAITDVVEPGSRIVYLYYGKLYGYEWGFEQHPQTKLEKVLRKVSYSIIPELLSVLS